MGLGKFTSGGEDDQEDIIAQQENFQKKSENIVSSKEEVSPEKETPAAVPLNKEAIPKTGLGRFSNGNNQSEDLEVIEYALNNANKSSLLNSSQEAVVSYNSISDGGALRTGLGRFSKAITQPEDLDDIAKEEEARIQQERKQGDYAIPESEITNSEEDDKKLHQEKLAQTASIVSQREGVELRDLAPEESDKETRETIVVNLKEVPELIKDVANNNEEEETTLNKEVPVLSHEVAEEVEGQDNIIPIISEKSESHPLVVNKEGINTEDIDNEGKRFIRMLGLYELKVFLGELDEEYINKIASEYKSIKKRNLVLDKKEDKLSRKGGVFGSLLENRHKKIEKTISEERASLRKQYDSVYVSVGEMKDNALSGYLRSDKKDGKYKKFKKAETMIKKMTSVFNQVEDFSKIIAAYTNTYSNDAKKLFTELSSVKEISLRDNISVNDILNQTGEKGKYEDLGKSMDKILNYKYIRTEYDSLNLETDKWISSVYDLLDSFKSEGKDENAFNRFLEIKLDELFGENLQSMRVLVEQIPLTTSGGGNSNSEKISQLEEYIQGYKVEIVAKLDEADKLAKLAHENDDEIEKQKIEDCHISDEDLNINRGFTP